MKKLKFLLAILFAVVSFSLVSCDPAGGTIIPPDDPTVKPAVIDTVIIELSIATVPDCARVGAPEIKFWHPALPNGYFDQTYNQALRAFTYVYTGDIAKAMIGTTCKFAAVVGGDDCNGYRGNFQLINGDPSDTSSVVVTIKRGVNKVVLEYKVTMAK